MNFIDIPFCIFIPVFLGIYYIVPPKYRYIVIFLGSYIFYGYSNPKVLLVLALATFISYFGGIAIYKWNYSKAAYALSFSTELLLLVVYKYLDLVLPIGLSFIVFQACTYLSDVYRKRITIEKNIIRYGAFVSFFPTVLSGPIQKAKNLLPQIKEPASFDYEQAQKGVLLFVWGLFEKIMVANRLIEISSTVFSDYLNRSSAEMLIGAMSFSLYIYADFSSYSDMARGISKILGINVGKNFNNPYLAKTTAEFWNRWHMSLNDWFIDNVYIPLGGNRRGVVRKYINMMVVFGISGLWHGSNWHFGAWGLINGAFVVIGHVLKPYKKYIYTLTRTDEETESIVFMKRGIVFLLITLTWVFFKNGIVESFVIWKRIILFDFVSIFNPELLNIAGSAAATFVSAIMTVAFCVVQCGRADEGKRYVTYSKQPYVIQCFLVAAIICICIFSIFNTDAYTDTQFLYFQF